MDVSLQYLQNEQQLSHWFLTGKPQNTAHESFGPHSSNNHLKLMPLTNSNMHFYFYLQLICKLSNTEILANNIYQLNVGAVQLCCILLK